MHDLAERYLYAVHMTQHLLYTLVAAPLLVVGIPVWMWRAVLPPGAVRTAWRVVTKPVVALVVFNGILLFTHWPAVVTASVSSELDAPRVAPAARRVGAGDVVAGGLAVAGDAPDHPAGADALPVLPVAGADDPGVVPHVRHPSAVSRLRDVPADLGDLGARATN